MNLFIAGIGQSQDTKDRIRRCLVSMRNVYPHLDEESVYSSGNEAFMAGVHTVATAIGPRLYHCESEDGALVYDGVPIDTSAKFKAFDAKLLARHWTSLPDVLEGQFCVVRICGNPDCIEVLIDPLGMYQLYYMLTPTGMLLSNSIELINRVTGNFSLDTLGASYFLGMGWSAGDRTLRDGVRVLRPGYVWRWQADRSDFLRKPYFALGDYSRLAKRDFGASETQFLAEELSRICRGLEEYDVNIECPITAGRDSRLLTALMAHNSILAHHFSSGPADSPDVLVGSAVANALKVEHKAGDTDEQGIDTILDHWQVASERLLRQTDGMVTLAAIGNAMHPQYIDRLNIELYGAAGEIARPYFFKGDPLYYLLNYRPESFTEYLIQKLIRPREWLLREGVRERAREFVKRFTQKAIDSGFSTRDLDAVFYTQERTRRWAGICMRTITSYTDVFVPLATRPYVKAALSIPAYQRYSERVPKALIHFLAPELDSIPLQMPWHAQSRSGILTDYFLSRSRRTLPARAFRKIVRVASGAKPAPVRAGARDLQRSMILESKLDHFRSFCLDQKSSDVWQLVNRDRLEDIMSPSKDAQDRRRHMDVLYDVFTLFQYTSMQRQDVRSDPG